MNKTYLAVLASLTVFTSPSAVEAQGEGPCALLTTAEVQQAFPGAKPGQLDRKLEKEGILRCVWTHPAGTLLLFADKDVDESPKEEARGWTATFLDPLRGDAERHVRYEVLSGIGDQAVAVVEREDKAKGFTQNGAILVVKRGQRLVSALSTDLARRERTEALRVFTELGKAIAKRLN